MTIEQKVKMALAHQGMSQAALARALGQSPANLNQKLKRNTLTQEDMGRIAQVLNCVWRAEFVFEDGTVI